MASGEPYSLRQAAGRVLMAGLEGPQLSAIESAWLKLLRPAGVILFRRNLETAAQTRALLRSVQQIAGFPMLRAIDVEGGTVDRLRDMFAPLPSPASVAATRKPALFAAHGRLIGRELRILGLNVTLAPVLDLKTPASEKIMTGRAVSSSAAEVAVFAEHFLAGLQKEKILGCGKHFPGLGGGLVDSHHATPAIEKPFDLLWQEDLLPYRKLARRLPLVMMAHARYPLTASGDQPASISRFWTTKVLAQAIGFSGPVLSDDMEMGGILSHAGIGEAAILAIAAGTHLVEICRDPALIISAYEALLSEAEGSPAFARRLRLAAAKVSAFNRRHFKSDSLDRTQPSPVSLRRMQDGVKRFSQRVAAVNGQGAAPA